MTQTGRPALLAALRALIGERATDAAAVREAHGRSEAYHAPHPPDVVAFPETTAEVAAIVAACAAARVPVVPFGAGTSLEGNALSVHGGVCVDFARMNCVLDVSPPIVGVLSPGM